MGKPKQRNLDPARAARRRDLEAERRKAQERRAKEKESEGSPDVLDDFNHFKAFMESGLAQSAQYARGNHAINLLIHGVDFVGDLTDETLAANAFAGMACFRSCVRNLRASGMLVMWGYYSEVRIVLRSAYESASLGRRLALDLPSADKWVQKATWIPEGDTTKWLERTGVIDDELKNLYGRNYGMLSAWAHPSARTILSAATIGDVGVSFPTNTVFDREKAASVIDEMAVFATLACYLLRNAGGAVAAWPPEWVKSVDAIFSELGDAQITVDRDWEKLHNDYQELKRKVQSVAETEEMIRNHPYSMRNLSADTATPAPDRADGDAESGGDCAASASESC